MQLPTGDRYFTVLGVDYLRVKHCDEFLFQHVARGGAEGTTESYAGALALYLNWCAATSRSPADASEFLGRFMFWLRRYDTATEAMVGPGLPDVRGASRINTVLAAVREFYKHLVATHVLPATTLDAMYRVVDDRDLPTDVRGESGVLRYRMKPHHRIPTADRGVTPATDTEVGALLRVCQNARDRLIVILAVRTGMRRGELAGLRLEDVHLTPGQRTGCRLHGPHVHVVKRLNPNRAAAKSRRPRELPCDPLVVRVFDDWFAERDTIPGASDCDFVVLTLTGKNAGASVRPGLINEVLEALASRAGLDRNVHPHMLRHTMLSNVMDYGGTLDEAQALAGHASPTTTAIYNHPAAFRLREAVERVPTRAATAEETQ